MDKCTLEQGVMARVSRYGPVPGDTGCVSEVPDQRGYYGLFNGAGDVPGQSVPWCSQE